MLESLIESDPQKASELMKRSEEFSANKKEIRAIEFGKESDVYVGDDQYILMFRFLGHQIKRVFYFAHSLPSLFFLGWLEDSLVVVSSNELDLASKKHKALIFQASEAKLLCEIFLANE